MASPAYDGWTLRKTRTTVELVPYLLAYRTMAVTWFALVIIIPAVLFIGLTRGKMPRGNEPSIFDTMWICAAFGLPFLLPAIICTAGAIAARTRGKMLIVNRTTGEILLPQLHMTLRRDAIVRIDLIRSRWFRPCRHLREHASEMHIVIRYEAGVISLPVIGTGVGRKIADVADQVALAVDVPLLRIDDQTDYGDLHRAFVVRQCKKCDYNLQGNVSGICPECGTPLPAPRVDPPIN